MSGGSGSPPFIGDRGMVLAGGAAAAHRHGEAAPGAGIPHLQTVTV